MIFGYGKEDYEYLLKKIDDALNEKTQEGHKLNAANLQRYNEMNLYISKFFSKQHNANISFENPDKDKELTLVDISTEEVCYDLSTKDDFLHIINLADEMAILGHGNELMMCFGIYHIWEE